MFAFKVIAYYVAAILVLTPIFCFMFWNNHSEAEKESRPAFPTELMRTLFILGVAIFTGATVLTLCG